MKLRHMQSVLLATSVLAGSAALAHAFPASSLATAGLRHHADAATINGAAIQQISTNGRRPMPGVNSVGESRRFGEQSGTQISAERYLQGADPSLRGQLLIEFHKGGNIPGSGGGASDIRLKRDIAEVGRLDNGLGLYRYRYAWGDEAYVGVMAQEVERVVPDAVIYHPDGYLRVDYARLGLTLQTWDEWLASQAAMLPLAA